MLTVLQTMLVFSNETKRLCYNSLASLFVLFGPTDGRERLSEPGERTIDVKPEGAW